MLLQFNDDKSLQIVLVTPKNLNYSKILKYSSLEINLKIKKKRLNK